MRHFLRGFTMWVNGIDYGYELEEFQPALPDEQFVEHSFGGSIMTSQVSLYKIAIMEPTFKVATQNAKLTGQLMDALGASTAFTFRGAAVDEDTGTAISKVYLYQGRLATPSADAWTRDSAVGNGYSIKGVKYFRHESGGDLIHEYSEMPAKWVVNRIDRLAAINDALGR